MKKIVLLLCLSGICFSEVFYDVESLPALRTKQYIMNPPQKIVIFSSSRTGSSLVYNIFRFLFEEDSKLFFHHNDFNLEKRVLKTHRYDDMEVAEKEDIIYVYTLRNPMDASISNYRICPHKIKNSRNFARDLINNQIARLLYAENLEKEGKRVLRLKYEDFVDDIDFILDFIKDQFQISIDLRDKELIKKGYSKENIHLCIKNLLDFKEYLPISGFHGKHVIMEHYTPPENFLYWLEIYLNNVKPAFRAYGYFVENTL